MMDIGILFFRSPRESSRAFAPTEVENRNYPIRAQSCQESVFFPKNVFDWHCRSKAKALIYFPPGDGIPEQSVAIDSEKIERCSENNPTTSGFSPLTVPIPFLSDQYITRVIPPQPIQPNFIFISLFSKYGLNLNDEIGIIYKRFKGKQGQWTRQKIKSRYYPRI